MIWRYLVAAVFTLLLCLPAGAEDLNFDHAKNLIWSGRLQEAVDQNVNLGYTWVDITGRAPHVRPEVTG